MGWSTHVQERRKTGWELTEGREAAQRCDGSSSERILVPKALLLPVVPNLIDHLHSPRECGE